jgi:hypothetical protein
MVFEKKSQPAFEGVAAEEATSHVLAAKAGHARQSASKSEFYARLRPCTYGDESGYAERR